MGSAVVLGGRRTGGSAGFVRHLLEMALAMMVGMIASAAVFLTAVGMTVDEALRQHAVLFVVVQAFGMTVAMVAWMRHRGQGGEVAPRWPQRWSFPRSRSSACACLTSSAGRSAACTASQRSWRWCSSCSTVAATTAATLLSWPRADQAKAARSIAGWHRSRPVPFGTHAVLNYSTRGGDHELAELGRPVRRVVEARVGARRIARGAPRPGRASAHFDL